MANYTAENVVFVDTDGYVNEGQIQIQSLFYKGNTNGDIKIRAGTASDGPILYENGGADDDHFDTLIRSKNGIYVEVSNGAQVFLYLN